MRTAPLHRCRPPSRSRGLRASAPSVVLLLLALVLGMPTSAHGQRAPALDDFAAHFELGTALLRQASYEDAMLELRLAGRTPEGQASFACQSALADAAQRAGHVGIALVALQRAIELSDNPGETQRLEDNLDWLSSGYAKVTFSLPAGIDFPTDPLQLSFEGRDEGFGVPRLNERLGTFGLEEAVEYLPVGTYELEELGIAFTVRFRQETEVELPEELVTGAGYAAQLEAARRRARSFDRNQSGAGEIAAVLAARGGLQLVGGSAEKGSQAGGFGGEVEFGLYVGPLRIGVGAASVSHGLATGLEGEQAMLASGVLGLGSVGVAIRPSSKVEIVPFAGYGGGSLGRLQFACHASNLETRVAYEGECLVAVTGHGPVGGVDIQIGDREDRLGAQIHVAGQPLFGRTATEGGTEISAGGDAFQVNELPDPGFVVVRVAVQGGILVRF